MAAVRWLRSEEQAIDVTKMINCRSPENLARYFCVEARAWNSLGHQVEWARVIVYIGVHRNICIKRAMPRSRLDQASVILKECIKHPKNKSKTRRLCQALVCMVLRNSLINQQPHVAHTCSSGHALMLVCSLSNVWQSSKALSMCEV